MGIGNWGKNLARTFFQLPNVSLTLCCDTNKEVLKQAEILYPGTKITQDFKAVIDDKNVDAVVLAVPAVLHYQLAKQALLADKHVFVADYRDSVPDFIKPFGQYIPRGCCGCHGTFVNRRADRS